jgi:hypothetical protein
LGKKFKDLFGNIFGPELSGLVGLKEPRDHGVPYSLTEEFVSVYRMHALLPEEMVLRNIKPTTEEQKCPPILEKYTHMISFSLVLVLYLRFKNILCFFNIGCQWKN